MNTSVPDPRPLIVFRGPVQVQAGRGAATLLLHGHEVLATDPRREYTELAFAAAQAAPLPAVLRDARVFGPEQSLASADALHRYRIEAVVETGVDAEVPWSAEVLARSVQLHREAALAFFGAVAPPRLPRSRRLFWLLLLFVLRVPGVTRLVERFRGEA